MIEFGGFITVEDAERIRKLEIIAQNYFENNVDDEIPPGSWKDYMAPQEAKAKGSSLSRNRIRRLSRVKNKPAALY